MPTNQALVFTVFGIAALTMGRYLVADLTIRNAHRVFDDSLRRARDAGRERAFMERFNSVAVYGDSLDKVVRHWGARGIRQILQEALQDARSD